MRVNTINIHRLSRWFFIFGLLALYYQQRASRAYDDLAVMRLLLATRKRAFLVLIFLHLWLCPSFIFSLFFYFPVYFSILAFSSFFAFFLFHSLLLFFLFIGKASLEPADYPRVLLYNKAEADMICLRKNFLKNIYCFPFFPRGICAHALTERSAKSRAL